MKLENKNEIKHIILFILICVLLVILAVLMFTDDRNGEYAGLNNTNSDVIACYNNIAKDVNNSKDSTGKEITNYIQQINDISLAGMSELLDEYLECEPECTKLLSLDSEQEPNYKDLEVPNNNSFKSYMDYKAITNKSSKQYELQKDAYTDCIGLRCVDERICIAVGSYYSTTIGQKLDVHMKNNEVLHCIVADLKADKHTDKLNQQHLLDKSVIEFVVNSKKIPHPAKQMGNMEYAHEDFWGEIDFIRVYQLEESE